MNKANQKKQKLNVAGAETVAADNHMPARPFILNVDCLEQIFDYLSLNDIYAMSETCKWMRQVAGYYFRQNFPAVDAEMDSEDIYLSNNTKSPRNGFSQFIEKLYFIHPVEKLKTESFLSLKRLSFCSDLDATEIEYMKDILGNIEMLDVAEYAELRDEWFKQLLSHCTKLKRFKLDCCNLSRFEITKDWLQTNHTLEFLALNIQREKDAKHINLVSILVPNPNLKHFKINAAAFWTHRNSLVGANVRLDSLIIKFEPSVTANRHFADLLLKLHERGFYKSLHLDLPSEKFEVFINQVGSLSALEMMDLTSLNDGVGLSPLIHLKELSFYVIDDTEALHLDIAAQNLINLEKLSVGWATKGIITPFIRYSKKLKVVRAIHFNDTLKRNILDLAALNKQRQQLDGAHKVSIGVEEKVYLATKWATKYWNFNMVEIKRKESIIWGNF